MKNRLLLTLVAGQAVVIVALAGYLIQRKQTTQTAQTPVAGQVANSGEGLATTPLQSDTENKASGPNQREGTLEEALEIARNGLAAMQSDLTDYRGRIVKRERVDGELSDITEMEIKIQERLKDGDAIKRPMRVYLKFVQPSNVAGREVIWEENQRDGKLVAHEPGLMNVAQAWLEPTGRMAMGDNLYPISEIGMQNLVIQLIQRGENDFNDAKVKVQFTDNTMVGDCLCQKIRIEQLQRREDLDFQVAEIFIDSKRQIPLRYAAYAWPDQPGGEPPLLEEYNYLDIETNVGLSDSDFDPENEAYNFPSFKVSL